MVKPVPGKVYLASADGPEIELVALPHGDFQEIGWLDAPLTTGAPQTYSNHAGSKAIDVSFADAAKLTTSISFDAVHAPPLALYWGTPTPPSPANLMPSYTGEAALAPADQAVPTSFPKPSLDGLVKPPTPAQKKMLDGVALTGEEEEETSTPLLTDALISQSLKESFLGPGWANAGYITDPEPLKWDDIVAAFKPVQAGLEKMHTAIESSVKTFQEIIAKHSVAISNAYDQLPTPYSGNPFAPKDVEVTNVDSNSGRAVSLRRLVPGIDDVVKLPCFHGGTNSIWLAIQHLNDYHNPNDGDREPWTREAIADWLETLDADLRVADAPVKHTAAVHLPQDELKDWPPEIILNEPLSWQSYGVYSWQKTPNLAQAKLLLELTGSALEPLSLGDVVRLDLGTAKDEGKVVQYQINSNTEPMTITYTVQWGPGGPTSVHSRDELVLVEAYKPPSDDIIDWGSKKITKIHPNVY